MRQVSDRDVADSKIWILELHTTIFRTTARRFGCGFPRMLSSRHYLLYQRQNREDEQVKKDVEFNIFDALCQVYDRQTTEEGRKECVDTFKSLYPSSSYSLENRQVENGLLEPAAFEAYLKDRLSVIHSICSEVNKR